MDSLLNSWNKQKLRNRMGTEKFCLRWNDFESNISSAFRELRDNKDFFDVTLACDGAQIQAHKVIISACSPFFCTVLRTNPHQHPLLYLKGVKYIDLQAVLNFMYHGEVNVAQEDLNSFLAVAEDLKVKGLTQNQSENDRAKNSIIHSYKQPPQATKHVNQGIEKNLTLPHKKSRPNSPHSYRNASLSQCNEDEEIQEVIPIKSEPRENPAIEKQQTSLGGAMKDQTLATFQEETEYEEYQQYQEEDQYQDQQKYQLLTQDTITMQMESTGQEQGLTDPEDLYQYVQNNPEGRGFLCTICNKARPKRAEVRHHVEAIHFPDTFCYQCQHCDKQFRSKNAMKVHTTSSHSKL